MEGLIYVNTAGRFFGSRGLSSNRILFNCRNDNYRGLRPSILNTKKKSPSLLVCNAQRMRPNHFKKIANNLKKESEVSRVLVTLTEAGIGVAFWVFMDVRMAKAMPGSNPGSVTVVPFTEFMKRVQSKEVWKVEIASYKESYKYRLKEGVQDHKYNPSNQVVVYESGKPSGMYLGRLMDKMVKDGVEIAAEGEMDFELPKQEEEYTSEIGMPKQEEECTSEIGMPKQEEEYTSEIGIPLQFPVPSRFRIVDICNYGAATFYSISLVLQLVLRINSVYEYYKDKRSRKILEQGENVAFSDNVGLYEAKELEDIIREEKKCLTLQHREKSLVARHEVGHAIVGTAVATFLPGQPQIEELSMLPSVGQHYGSVYKSSGNEDGYLIYMDQLRGQLVTLLGGYAAEEVTLGCVSNRSLDDIKQATDMAFEAIAERGLDQLTLSSGFCDASRELPQCTKYNGHALEQILKEVKALLQSALEAALVVIHSNAVILEGLGTQLEATEKIDGKLLKDWLHQVVAPAEIESFIHACNLKVH